MFVNLKKTNCTILNKNFQFCIFNLKIVNFVCDLNDVNILVIQFNCFTANFLKVLITHELI